MAAQNTSNYTPHSRQRFAALEPAHQRAIMDLIENNPILHGRMEIHLPYAQAKKVLGSQPVWVWPKFDRRPVSYLIFMEDWPVCLWSPDRQEGRTFRWIAPPNFTERGPTVFLANLLVGESVLQVEDLVIYKGRDLWSRQTFSQRWQSLTELWETMPAEQPLLTFKPALVQPVALTDWASVYDASLSWIFQPDWTGQPRWFWRDVVTKQEKREYRAPTIKRFPGIPTIAVAEARPFNAVLPDTYSLFSQEGEKLGVAAVSGLELSQSLRKAGAKFGVEVCWETEFNKFRILRIMPEGTPVAPQNTFLQIQQAATAAATKNTVTE